MKLGKKGRFNMHIWLQQFQEKLIHTFQDNLYFVGLQGSRARYEAQQKSDIDVVVLFRDFSFETLQAYETVAATMPNRFLLCGFVGGIDDIYKWSKADLFTFVYDTTPLYGDITSLQSLICTEDIEQFIRTTAGEVYHGVLHNYMHAKSTETIERLFKNARFAIQGRLFLQHSTYVGPLTELLHQTIDIDKVMIERFIALKNSGFVQIHDDTEKLLQWAQNTLHASRQ